MFWEAKIFFNLTWIGHNLGCKNEIRDKELVRNIWDVDTEKYTKKKREKNTKKKEGEKILRKKEIKREIDWIRDVGTYTVEKANKIWIIIR